ncbi:YggS family pyridoxal phosphate-dependent enzyme [Clostridium tarantellae]|uniref:Pyridoxal phosphate homeostasis protein n=1 Tax=Clostridium tarantellae TaxID=39493 RepID=A0A6I1MPD6_9CLOT|nr:YggS family pyridoxal phosphate-dependent enzyme [Clostridium tarantellae]MPQ43987.1 YggS family pyridoxal phosphate-dependent enzyme [Clostridium tarantellae]
MGIEENIKKILKDIPEEVKVIAVSKTKPIEDMNKVYDLGLRDFGENKVQEFLYKFENFKKDVKWHLIGHLQTNKVKYIVGKVELIQSLDSIKLLKEIEKVYSNHNVIANTLLQINIGREQQKYGVLEEDIKSILEYVEKCNFVKIKGIMVIIPKGTEAENSLYFKKTHDIWSNLKFKKYKNVTMEILSMGMSNDYHEAIKNGSNMIRVGTGIFGKRN